MNISEIVRGSVEYSKRYAYYHGLGYSEKASEILSVLTYGERNLRELIQDLGEDRVIERLYGWLTERDEKDPGTAIRNYLNEKRRKEWEEQEKNRPKPGMGEKLASAIGGALAQMNSGKAGARVKSRAVRDEGRVVDEECLVEDVCFEAAAPAMMAAAAPVGMAMKMPMPGMPAPGMPVPELMEATATDSYEHIEEKDAVSPLTAPTSTFRMTTNTASMGVVLNQIREGRHIDISQVRIEELLNYFTYGYEAPKEEVFRIDTELQKSAEDKGLLYIHVGAKQEQKEEQNIVLLLDVSGSMSSQAVVAQETIATVVSKLKKGDIFSLVTYSSRDETVYAGYEIKGDGDKEDVMGRILSIEITGCTNGSAGIYTAYKIGSDNYKKDGNNQVILITDGDLNFGVVKKDGLEALIEEKKTSNLFLSVIGTGLYNYKDDKLEVLSKHGNGTYCVVNTLEDVEESVNKRYISLTNIIAKDVKAQVEFNPAHVKSYRLLGYENRALSHEDFKNDKVISEPYGSGGQGVALYEIVRGNAADAAELKYQKPQLTGSDELCTVKVRYKEPLAEESIEISKVVGQECNGGENAKLARFLYCIGEKLRKSDKLSAEDNAFYTELAQSGKYKELPGDNAEVLKMLVDYIG
ncbi:MAG: von Willebrand factor type A domain-containing protein [Lachnospiraceae bacterium]|nr:von Willebrand factor type A domain-containing protein [Lachnospiraceae bacterium]